MKFRTRLFLFYILAVGLITLIMAGYFIAFEETRVRRSFQDHLLIQARLIATNFMDEALLKDPRQVSVLISKLSQTTQARITIISTDGTVLGDSSENYRKMSNHRDRPEVKAALRGLIGSSARYSKTLKHNMIYVAYPVQIDAKILGVVRVAKNQDELTQLLFRLKGLIVGGITLAVILATLFGILAMRRIIKPVLHLQRLATRLSRGDLSGRVRIFGQDELADLGQALNMMAEKLSHSFSVIKDEKRKLEVILENLVDGILVIDRELKIILANPASQEMLGLSRGNIQGRPILEVVMNHHLLDLIQEVARQKDPFESELTLHYPQDRQIQIFLAPLNEETGILAGSIVVLHDQTLLRRLERVRQDFVANVSHELRTPIALIKAMAETLLGGASENKEILMRYLRAIDQESDRLTNLINDLLDLAKLDSKTEIPRESFNLIELIYEVKERFLPIPGVTPSFYIDLPEEDLPEVKANRNQVKQVLINLLDNAFKYTPSNGQVKISVGRTDDRLKVAVADTGIGIPETDLDRVFERFYRVDKARSRELGGTGLGLSIVKNIIEAYGGKVKVESILNKGSIFSFTLPTEISD